MALRLDVTDPSTGVTASYWRLARAIIDAAQRTAQLTFQGFVSQDIRAQEGGRAVQTRELRATGAEFDTFFGPDAKGSVYTQAYLYAQSTQSPDPAAPRTLVKDDGDDGPGRFVVDTTPPFAGARKA
ncbi:MAG TPA: hypothetical protein VGB53_00850 [Rubricoccaceae bacterium]